jgi:hypothetical protein
MIVVLGYLASPDDKVTLNGAGLQENESVCHSLAGVHVPWRLLRDALYFVEFSTTLSSAQLAGVQQSVHPRERECDRLTPPNRVSRSS